MTIRIREDFPSESHAGCYGKVFAEIDGFFLVQINGAPAWSVMRLKAADIEIPEQEQAV